MLEELLWISDEVPGKHREGFDGIPVGVHPGVLTTRKSNIAYSMIVR